MDDLEQLDEDIEFLRMIITERKHPSAFVKRCVGAVTNKVKGDTSRAFAICKSSEQKYPGAAHKKKRVSKEKKRRYEKALAAGRRRTRAHKKAGRPELRDRHVDD